MITKDIDYITAPTMDAETHACFRLWAHVFRLGVADTVAQWKCGDFREGWIDDKRSFPGSFDWLCELFNFDPDKLRSQIRMNARKLERELRVK